MGNLVDHAKRELEILGMGEDSDEMNKSMRDSILAIVEKFGEQGHSGFSAAYAINTLGKLLAYEPLAPLTGEDSEWVDVGEQSGAPLWQNNRCSHVFKDKKRAYDIEGKVFREPDGSCYTNGKSRVTVTFPYVPQREYVDVKAKTKDGKPRK